MTAIQKRGQEQLRGGMALPLEVLPLPPLATLSLLLVFFLKFLSLQPSPSPSSSSCCSELSLTTYFLYLSTSFYLPSAVYISPPLHLLPPTRLSTSYTHADFS